jgi:DNA-binding NarL/FixJ family response regulator
MAEFITSVLRPLPATGSSCASDERLVSSLSSIRVLVVEDFEPFRRFIISTLKTRPELQLIGEASDGLEAVQKAHDLRPDLIVLDIGLPTLNGIEAARRIRELSPDTKILFLSQESSADVAQEALGLGALGYVVKAHAGSELLAAVELVLQGKPFISEGVSPFNFAPDRLYFREAPAPKKEVTTRRHEIAYYSDHAAFVLGFAGFVDAALRVGRPVIVIASESHRQSLVQNLRSQGVDTAGSIGRGGLMLLDVFEVLSAFMVNGRPDRVRFAKAAGDLIAAAARTAKAGHLRIAACGECAPTLLEQGGVDAAIELEHLWDEIARTRDVDILCGYVLSGLPSDYKMAASRRIEAEHSAVRSL